MSPNEFHNMDEVDSDALEEKEESRITEHTDSPDTTTHRADEQKADHAENGAAHQMSTTGGDDKYGRQKDFSAPWHRGLVSSAYKVLSIVSYDRFGSRCYGPAAVWILFQRAWMNGGSGKEVVSRGA
ncbi:hypothetical protein PG997_008189 [Apiospora hydei]|uniref:Uncharacterized protein n=1 Tax=Apiospora hydei TaxID=1337664 RepID=A0ABR1WA56_9PEZI